MPEPTSGPSNNKKAKPAGTATQLAELKGLVVGYAKQETVDPLRTLGRYLGFGLAGSVLIGSGLALLLLALLRGLQTIDLFNDPGKVDGGTWTWVPYLIAGLAGTLLVVLFMSRLISMLRGPKWGPND